MALPSFILDRREAVAALCRRRHARRLELFGSATRADFAPERSELDFLVDLPSDLPPGGYANAFFGLKRDLEALFERPVDLLDAERLMVYGV